MRRLLAAINTASSGVTIGQFLWQFIVPIAGAVLAAITAFWGWAANWGYLPIFLAVLFVFAAVLWSYIGIQFVRAKPSPSGSGTAPQVKYDPSAWGLEIPNMRLVYIAGDDAAEWVFRASLINRFPWPLRVFIEKMELNLESRTPETDVFPANGIIIAGMIGNVNSFPDISLMRFKPDLLPKKSAFEGNVRFEILYGYPDAGYTRRAIREYFIAGPVVNRPFHPTMCVFQRRPIREDEEPYSLPSP